MQRVRHLLLVLFSVISVVSLSACGGGGSSSGGGVSKAATAFAGNYLGFEALTASGPGGSFPVGTFPLSVTIAPDGGVIVIDVDGTTYSGRLGGLTNNLPPNNLPPNNLQPNQFIASAMISVPPLPGFFCQPTPNAYIGTVTGNTINGNVTARFLCNVQGVSAVVVVGGPFTATRTAGVAPGVSVPSPRAPSPGSQRKSRKQKAIADGVGAVF